jgi:predicted HAD superfamily phosphohydrolase YqeG
MTEVTQTTLGDLSNRINAKVMDINDYLVSTDLQTLENHLYVTVKKINLKKEATTIINNMDVEQLQKFIQSIQTETFGELVPWQSFINRFNV